MFGPRQLHAAGADDLLEHARDGLFGEFSWRWSRSSAHSCSGDAGSNGCSWFLWVGVATMFLPFVAITAGWMLTEIGRQPWIVQGLLKTADANSPAVSSAMLVFSITVFVVLYLTAARRRRLADAALRQGRPAGARPRRGRRNPDANDRLLRWTCRCSGSACSPSSSAATSCSRASISASGCCCRSCRGTRRTAT